MLTGNESPLFEPRPQVNEGRESLRDTGGGGFLTNRQLLCAGNEGEQAQPEKGEGKVAGSTGVPD